MLVPVWYLWLLGDLNQISDNQICSNIINRWLRYLWNCPQILDFTDEKSTLVEVMAWCRQAGSHYLSQYCCLTAPSHYLSQYCCLTAPSHYLSQYWPSSMSPYGHSVLTHCGWYKASVDDIFRFIFLNENCCTCTYLDSNFTEVCS